MEVVVKMKPQIQQVIAGFDYSKIPAERKEVLTVLVDYIQKKRERQEEIHLNFICTHNSRRSQFSQLWAQVAADYFGVSIRSYSGGVEETAFNERAVFSLMELGFSIDKKGEVNPHYRFDWEGSNSLEMFSKMYDDSSNALSGFAAIMTCSHADENCPIISGCEVRIPIRYDDPKLYDDTPLEKEKYRERSLEIAQELFYVFNEVAKK